MKPRPWTEAEQDLALHWWRTKRHMTVDEVNIRGSAEGLWPRVTRGMFGRHIRAAKERALQAGHVTPPRTKRPVYDRTAIFDALVRCYGDLRLDWPDLCKAFGLPTKGAVVQWAAQARIAGWPVPKRPHGTRGAELARAARGETLDKTRRLR